ncbi:hypothetical protein ACVWZV_002220 [Bradyrhizobium sp. GM5.1]
MRLASACARRMRLLWRCRDWLWGGCRSFNFGSGRNVLCRVLAFWLALRGVYGWLAGLHSFAAGYCYVSALWLCYRCWLWGGCRISDRLDLNHSHIRESKRHNFGKLDDVTAPVFLVVVIETADYVIFAHTPYSEMTYSMKMFILPAVRASTATEAVTSRAAVVLTYEPALRAASRSALSPATVASAYEPGKHPPRPEFQRLLPELMAIATTRSPAPSTFRAIVAALVALVNVVITSVHAFVMIALVGR